MIADYVKCNNCEKESYIPRGEEICPNCKIEGCLTWADERQEAEVDEYKIIERGKENI